MGSGAGRVNGVVAAEHPKAAVDTPSAAMRQLPAAATAAGFEKPSVNVPSAFVSASVTSRQVTAPLVPLAGPMKPCRLTRVPPLHCGVTARTVPGIE